MITPKALQELKEIFQSEKGYVPDEKELVLYGTQLLTLIDQVFKPVKKDWVQKYEQQRARNPAE